jgi:hypothetical protein
MLDLYLILCITPHPTTTPRRLFFIYIHQTFGDHPLSPFPNMNTEIQPEDSSIELSDSISIKEPHDIVELQESILEAQYFDASSMAPLSAASVVSIPQPKP